MERYKPRINISLRCLKLKFSILPEEILIRIRRSCQTRADEMKKQGMSVNLNIYYAAKLNKRMHDCVDSSVCSLCCVPRDEKSSCKTIVDM